MRSQTTLDHVLNEAESLEVELTRARGGCRHCILSLFLDFRGQPIVASLLRDLALGVDLRRLPHRPGDHGDAGGAPEETSRVDQPVSGEGSCKKSRTKPQEKRKEDSTHGKPYKKSHRNTDQSEDKSQGCWDVANCD